MKPQVITPVQQRDTVLALLLILLILFFFFKKLWLLWTMAAVLVLGMTLPRLFTPAAKIWFGFSALLGHVMSKVIMAVIFLFILTPVGLIRRALGKDPMRLKEWKQGANSVFIKRNHQYINADLKNPY